MAETELSEATRQVLVERLWLDVFHALRALSIVATDGQLAVLLNTILAENDLAVAALARLDRNTAADDALEHVES